MASNFIAPPRMEHSDIYIVENPEEFTVNTDRSYRVISAKEINEDKNFMYHISTYGNVYINAELDRPAILEIEANSITSTAHIRSDFIALSALSSIELESGVEASSLYLETAKKANILGAMLIRNDLHVQTNSYFENGLGNINEGGFPTPITKCEINFTNPLNIIDGRIQVSTPLTPKKDITCKIAASTDLTMENSLVAGNLTLETEKNISIKGSNVVTGDLTVDCAEFTQEEVLLGGELKQG